jgi:hypothetical protein
MSDYTQITDFSVKDALLTGNPSKLVKGTEFDAEFDAISTAITSKYDSADLASQAQAEAATDGTVLMTPQRVGQWADANGGMVGDIQALADPNADGILFWDDSAGAAALLTPVPATGGVEINGTDLRLDLDSLTNVTPVATDELVVADASDSGLPKAVLLSALATLFETQMNHDSLTGFVSNEHINHTSVSVTAGTGLSGGGTIAATRTINLDISSLSAYSAPVGTDGFLVDNGGTMNRVSFNSSALPSRNVSSSGNFASTDVGEIVYWTGTSGTLTVPTGVGQDDCYIIVVNSGSGTLTIAGSGVTVNSANSLLDIPAGGMATLIRETSTVWFLGGSLQ